MFRRTRIMILAGAALMAAALALGTPRANAHGTPTPEHRHAAATPGSEEHDHEHADSVRLPADGAAVRIVSPKGNAVLTENAVIVKVETTNWPLGEGKHFHLYVNGQEQSMSQGSSASVQARDLVIGENTLEVVLSNDLHRELDATDKITVRMELLPTVSPATTSTGGLVAIVGIGALVLGGIGFVIIRRRR